MFVSFPTTHPSLHCSLKKEKKKKSRFECYKNVGSLSPDSAFIDLGIISYPKSGLLLT